MSLGKPGKAEMCGDAGVRIPADGYYVNTQMKHDAKVLYLCIFL